MVASAWQDGPQFICDHSCLRPGPRGQQPAASVSLFGFLPCGPVKPDGSVSSSGLILFHFLVLIILTPSAKGWVFWFIFWVFFLLLLLLFFFGPKCPVKGLVS